VKTGQNLTYNQEVKEDSSFLKKRSKRLLLFRRFRDGSHGRELAAGAMLEV
jgi:hypothetical protein